MFTDPNQYMIKNPAGVSVDATIVAQFTNPHPYILRPVTVVGEVYIGPNGNNWVAGHDLEQCIRAWEYPNPYDEKVGTVIVDDQGQDGWLKTEKGWECTDGDSKSDSASEIDDEYYIAWVGVWVPR